MTNPPEFQLFSTAHLAALFVAAAVTLALVTFLAKVATDPLRGRVRLGLGALVLALVAAHIALGIATDDLEIMELVPLHLCDFALFVAAFAALSNHRGAAEVVLFWALTGTLLAMVTPALYYGFPHWRFFSYFMLHGAVVLTAAALVFGMGRKMRRRAWLRAFVATNAYAGVIALINIIGDTNFLFLCRKPSAETLLDSFGPWPIYLFVCEGLALFLFLAIYGLIRAAGHVEKGTMDSASA